MIRGSCLCGGVQFRIQDKCSRIHRCHCSLCRKRTGAGSNAVTQVRPALFEWVGGRDQIREYRSELGHGSRFCAVCGSPVPSFDESMGRVWVPVGALDDEPGVGVWAHFCVASKAEWDEICDEVPQFDYLPDG